MDFDNRYFGSNSSGDGHLRRKISIEHLNMMKIC